MGLGAWQGQHLQGSGSCSICSRAREERRDGGNLFCACVHLSKSSPGEGASDLSENLKPNEFPAGSGEQSCMRARTTSLRSQIKALCSPCPLQQNAQLHLETGAFGDAGPSGCFWTQSISCLIESLKNLALAQTWGYLCSDPPPGMVAAHHCMYPTFGIDQYCCSFYKMQSSACLLLLRPV